VSTEVKKESDAMKRAVETTEEFKARIGAIINDKTEHIAGAPRPHPMLVRKRKARGRKTKRLALLAAAALMGVGSVRALPLSYLIEEQRAKIEPAGKLFQKECSGQAGSQACKEQHDALVKALNGFVSMVQKELALLDANAGDADFQKQTAARRTRMQQDLQWAQEQLKAVAQ
jgi:hypothetical protein